MLVLASPAGVGGISMDGDGESVSFSRWTPYLLGVFLAFLPLKSTAVFVFFIGCNRLFLSGAV